MSVGASTKHKKLNFVANKCLLVMLHIDTKINVSDSDEEHLSQ